jgi:dihydrofolate synthase/folylpolyglutamate synthase
VRVNERVQINGAAISDDDFARLYFRVDEVGTHLVATGLLPQTPSFFETMTALAFLYYREQKVDFVVLEVGMGGRLDATNIVSPLLSIITDISIDHTEWLGPTLAAIACEKAGILRPQGTMVTLPQHPEADRVLDEVATGLQCERVDATQYLPPPTAPAWHAQYPVKVLGKTVDLTLPLAGAHQHRNVALAVAAAAELRTRHQWPIDAETIAEGVRTTRWPGRLERFSLGAGLPEVLLDVAHNAAGAWTLRTALEKCPLTGPRTLVFGCMRDKPVLELVEILFPLFDHVVLTASESPRAASTKELLAAAATIDIPLTVADGPVQALAKAVATTSASGLVVVSGSIYLVGPVRGHILQQSSIGQAQP